MPGRQFLPGYPRRTNRLNRVGRYSCPLDLMYTIFLELLRFTVLSMDHVSFIPPSGRVNFVDDRVQSASRKNAMMSETRILLVS